MKKISVKKILDAVNHQSVALFSMMAVGPCAIDITPLVDYSVWTDFYWSARDISNIGFSGLALSLVPYERLELKALAFFITIWRVFVLLINILDIDPVYSPVFLVFCSLVFISFVIRCNHFGELKSVDPQGDEAFYALVPVHSKNGLIQALFLPWHMGRYETRIVVQDNKMWLVHRKKFKKVKCDLESLRRQGAVLVPLGQRLTVSQEYELNSLVGQSSIIGIRDCRKLMVAGRVRPAHKANTWRDYAAKKGEK